MVDLRVELWLQWAELRPRCRWSTRTRASNSTGSCSGSSGGNNRLVCEEGTEAEAVYQDDRDEFKDEEEEEEEQEEGEDKKKKNTKKKKTKTKNTHRDVGGGTSRQERI